MNRRFWAGVAGVFATALSGCSPGYMNRSELESKHQGPADCEARCVELGMRMGALVLVSDTLPGCVCQPQPTPAPPVPPPGQAPPLNQSPAAPASAAPPAAVPPPAVSTSGAAAVTTGSVVATMAAAAAARANQTDQHRRAQQSYIPP